MGSQNNFCALQHYCLVKCGICKKRINFPMSSPGKETHGSIDSQLPHHAFFTCQRSPATQIPLSLWHSSGGLFVQRTGAKDSCPFQGLFYSRQFPGELPCQWKVLLGGINDFLPFRGGWATDYSSKAPFRAGFICEFRTISHSLFSVNRLLFFF